MTATSEAELVVAVLAAGASERLGEPKALARLGLQDEDSSLALLLRAAASLRPRRILVVTGRHQAEIAEHHARHGLPGELLFNPNWSDGRTGGLALAASRCPGSDLCVAPVDVPLVPAEVFALLRQAWSAAGAPARGWLAPHVRSESGALQHGHPLVIGRALAATLAESPPERSLRHLRLTANPVWSIEVSSPRILDDLDTHEDLELLRRLAGE